MSFPAERSTTHAGRGHLLDALSARNIKTKGTDLHDHLNKVVPGSTITPGIDFGEGAEGYLRFSYANSLENIDRAMDLLGTFFREQRWL